MCFFSDKMNLGVLISTQLLLCSKSSFFHPSPPVTAYPGKSEYTCMCGGAATAVHNRYLGTSTTEKESKAHPTTNYDCHT